MSEIFNEIKKGLEQALAYEKGELTDANVQLRSDKIVRAVNGTMSLSDMPLTEEDKSRIRYCVEHPTCFDDTLKELIRKHHRDENYYIDVGLKR